MVQKKFYRSWNFLGRVARQIFVDKNLQRIFPFHSKRAHKMSINRRENIITSTLRVQKITFSTYRFDTLYIIARATCLANGAIYIYNVKQTYKSNGKKMKTSFQTDS